MAAAAIAGVLGVEAEAVREEIVAFVRDTARDGLLVSASSVAMTTDNADTNQL